VIASFLTFFIGCGIFFLGSFKIVHAKLNKDGHTHTYWPLWLVNSLSGAGLGSIIYSSVLFVVSRIDTDPSIYLFIYFFSSSVFIYTLFCCRAFVCNLAGYLNQKKGILTHAVPSMFFGYICIRPDKRPLPPG